MGISSGPLDYRKIILAAVLFALFYLSSYSLTAGIFGIFSFIGVIPFFVLSLLGGYLGYLGGMLMILGFIMVFIFCYIISFVLLMIYDKIKR